MVDQPAMLEPEFSAMRCSMTGLGNTNHTGRRLIESSITCTANAEWTNQGPCSRAIENLLATFNHRTVVASHAHDTEVLQYNGPRNTCAVSVHVDLKTPPAASNRIEPTPPLQTPTSSHLSDPPPFPLLRGLSTTWKLPCLAQPQIPNSPSPRRRSWPKGNPAASCSPERSNFTIYPSLLTMC
ncbi:uncharacterized protein E0L32_001450 [Thyridium curvatum]|uniref:Uncharacterized protein n=1 Tax=Thyridium curvatum TaxID=1093900 RepID=A0A507AR26_9PEZI|nr:uncharacterized protein E0L32_001450 [Thyridium curvatum]TPX10253.1 hypothetical protein E0L32_001450 [Thyridium curvatum]